jgi:radical SAM superfamily enzyme YgiQ (UPF0313 family)
VQQKEEILKLFLVQPSQLLEGGKVFKANKLMFPRLSLPVLASLTPPDIEVQIVDEHFEDVPFDLPVDLVGISFMTPQAPRAYQIGDEYKARGRAVVMGGVHASELPEEALQHSDAVVIGEAEGIWARVLEDFKRGSMKGIYRSPGFPGLSGLPPPRYDLLKQDRYRLFKINFPIQAGRGCPFRCEFCSVTRFFGGKIRFRPVEEVVQEIRQGNLKKIFFVDDNIVGHRAYARELFRALIPLKLRWVGQASLNLAKDEELLGLAKKSGCAVLFIGIESLSSESLKEIGKNFYKAEEVQESLQQILSYGITVRASIVFGFDHDEKDVFKRTVDFLIRNRIVYADFFILTPLPGTPLRVRMEKENRIFSNDWSEYDSLRAVFRPKLMSPEQLNEGLWEAYRNFYSVRNILKRVLTARGLNRLGRRLFSNFYYRSLILRKKHPIYGG